MRNKILMITAMLAVMVAMTGMAAADTMTVNTDASWKYSTTLTTGWNTLPFNDVSWSNAVEYGPNGVSPWGNVYPGTSARWIWSNNNPLGGTPDSNVYFRKEINIVGNPTSAWVNITTDNGYDLYVNGVLIGSDPNWGPVERYQVTLHSGNNIIAVKGMDWGYYAGVLADVNIIYTPNTSVPEFPTVALPIAAVIGLVFFFQQKKNKK